MWPIHTRDETHSYAWHDSFICVTWLIHMCDMTHSYVWHDSFIRVMRLMHDTSCPTHMNASRPTHIWMSLIQPMCRRHVSHIHIVTKTHLHATNESLGLISGCDVTHINMSISYKYECILLVTWARHKCVTWFIQIYIREHVTNVACSHMYMSEHCLGREHVTRVWRDSFKCVACYIQIYIYVSTSQMWRALIYTWANTACGVGTSQMCDVNHSNIYTWARHKCVACYIQICIREHITNVACSHIYISVNTAWDVGTSQVCDMIYSNVWRDPFRYVT